MRSLKSWLWWLTVLLIFILLILITYRISTAWSHNHRLQKEYTQAADPSPYQQGIPMESMDLAALASYWPRATALPLYDMTSLIETPVTMRYYAEIPNGKAEPALEIPKGTIIIAVPDDFPFFEIGYGYASYPTYEQGWRYVRPFLRADGEEQESQDQHYYVRIEELKGVIDEFIRANRSLQAASGQHRGGASHHMATSLDQVLYRHGVYLSPDLFHKVVDRVTVWLMTAMLLILLPSILLYIRFSRRAPETPSK